MAGQGEIERGAGLLEKSAQLFEAIGRQDEAARTRELAETKQG